MIYILVDLEFHSAYLMAIRAKTSDPREDAPQGPHAWLGWLGRLGWSLRQSAYGAPCGPMGEQKYPKIWFLRKELIFNLFQKSGTLLKPKYLDFGAMRNLGILA